MKKRLIVLSTTNDPYLNHALEETLFMSYLDYEQILFLWVNEPAVVFGRNQNPWREIDVRYAQSKDIKLLRRVSGGGTVYHDLGNLNYAFISHHGIYDEQAHFKLIIEAVKQLGMDLEISSRKDLTLNDYKVSGSAFFMKGLRRLHHGTLLVNANLEVLTKSLKITDSHFQKRFIQTRSIMSVPSKVRNLSQDMPNLMTSDVMNAIVDQYYISQKYEVDTLTICDIITAHQLSIQQAMQKHRSWTWVFGETPKFTFINETGKSFDIEGGTVKSSTQNESMLLFPQLRYS